MSVNLPSDFQLDIRPLPFPYRSALAFSNDPDFLAPDFYAEWARWLNSNEDGAFGPGLGIGFSSGVFFFSSRENQLSFYDGSNLDATESIWSKTLEQMIRDSWIDTNHSWGDFDQGPNEFSRAHAVRANEMMLQRGISLPIWTNHGSVRNAQCLGAGSPHENGDNSGSDSYHSDLLRGAGLPLFFSSSQFAIDPVSASDRARLLVASPLVALKDVAVRSRLQLRPQQFPYVLRDGSQVTVFKRFRGTGQYAPNLSSLDLQVKQVLSRLRRGQYKSEVVYQHVGVVGRNNEEVEVSSIDAVRRMGHVMETMRTLSGLQRMGELWVPRLFDLLRYRYLRSVVIAVVSDQVIELKVPSDLSIESPQEFFSGLSIITDRRITSIQHVGTCLEFEARPRVGPCAGGVWIT